MIANQAAFPVAVMARVLGVSKAGFYARRERAPSARQVADGVRLARLASLEAEADAIRTELAALDAAEPPAPAEITEDVDAQIHAAARQIESLISRPTHPDAPKLREMVRRMIERITIRRHESGAIDIAVRGAFAGVMQAAGLVERHALQTTKAGRDWAREAEQSVVAGARNHRETHASVLDLALVLNSCVPQALRRPVQFGLTEAGRRR